MHTFNGIPANGIRPSMDEAEFITGADYPLVQTARDVHIGLASHYLRARSLNRVSSILASAAARRGLANSTKAGPLVCGRPPRALECDIYAPASHCVIELKPDDEIQCDQCLLWIPRLAPYCPFCEPRARY